MILLEEFQRALQQSGGRLVGEGYYGVWAGYPYTAYVEKLRSPGEVSFDFRLEGPIQQPLFQELRRTLPKGCRLRAQAGFHYRILCKGRALQNCGESLAAILDAFTRDLSRARIVPPERCPLCRQGGCDAYADLDGYAAVHRDCVEVMTRNYRAQAEMKGRNGSYFTGYLGALLGGLLVSLLILGALALGLRAAWFGYSLLPVGAWFGYKLCRGRMNRGAVVCSGVVSVWYLLLMEQALFYIQVHLRYDIWPSVLATFLLYWETKRVGELVSDLWIPALCLAMGLWACWRQLGGHAGAERKTVNHIRATLCDRAS